MHTESTNNIIHTGQKLSWICSICRSYYGHSANINLCFHAILSQENFWPKLILPYVLKRLSLTSLNKKQIVQEEGGSLLVTLKIFGTRAKEDCCMHILFCQIQNDPKFGKTLHCAGILLLEMGPQLPNAFFVLCINPNFSKFKVLYYFYWAKCIIQHDYHVLNASVI